MGTQRKLQIILDKITSREVECKNCKSESKFDKVMYCKVQKYIIERQNNIFSVNRGITHDTNILIKIIPLTPGDALRAKHICDRAIRMYATNKNAKKCK